MRRMDDTSWTCGARAGLKFWIQSSFGQFQVGFQILKTFKFPKLRQSEILTKCYQAIGICVSDPFRSLASESEILTTC